MSKIVRHIILALVISLLAILGINNLRGTEEPDASALAEANEIAEPVQVPVELLYGIPLDSFEVVQDKVKKNEFLADILNDHLPYQVIHNGVQNAEGIFDVRQIRSGKPYALFFTPDTTHALRYFVYQKNAIDYVVMNFGDSVKVTKGQHKVSTKERIASGKIESSLFNALKDAGLSGALAMEMSEIYAWSIDFYRLQKGDFFKVVFDEKFVNDEFIGVGDIKCSLFSHGGKPFYAFSFQADSLSQDYFDEEGMSLRKAFLQSPLKFGRISSGYTMKRYHPVQKRYKAHLGTDYAAPSGTPILAVGDGTVIERKYKRYNGNYVKIRHNGTYTTQYLHMSKFNSNVKKGSVVKQGDVIGYVGSTGLATGPHVCFRFWKNGKQVDHRREDFPSAEPIPEEMKVMFNHSSDSLKTVIDQYPLPEESKGNKLATLPAQQLK